MHERFILSRRVFHAALMVLLVAAVVAGTSWSPGRTIISATMLIASCIALGARLRCHRFQQAIGTLDHPDDLGGYPSELLRHPSFLSRRLRAS